MRSWVSMTLRVLGEVTSAIAVSKSEGDPGRWGDSSPLPQPVKTTLNTNTAVMAILGRRAEWDIFRN